MSSRDVADALTHPAPQAPANAWQVFWVFLKLGLTSFGGPVAHLAYFREAFVVRHRWLSEHDYAHLVALCQFLPGPASSQVGMALGLMQAGYRGALAAWLGFTLPSALALIALAMGLSHWQSPWATGALHGLKLVAVPIVAHAVWGMARSLCPDTPRRVLALAAAVLLWWWPGLWAQWVVLAVSGGVAWLAWRALGWTPVVPPAGQASVAPETPSEASGPRHLPSRRCSLAWLGLFVLALAALPALSTQTESWAVVNAFYRAGALVFGGGHVVLPLLQAELVPTGWMDTTTFLAGYGAAQAVPGPLFTLAAFLGASSTVGPGGWWGGLLALVAIFVPAFLVLVAALPWWHALRRQTAALVVLAGVNAGVVGLLLAALVNPVASSALRSGTDVVIVALLALALFLGRWPAWAVVLLSAVMGAVAVRWLPL
jgi:chromate transporter